MEGQNLNRRSANFTIDEEQLLVSLIDKYRDVVECKRSNCFTWKEKESAWQIISVEFNSSSGRCPRSLRNLKEKFNNIKKRTKLKYAEEKKSVLRTGGGQYTLPPETEIDVAVKEILGQQLTGSTNSYDDDRNQLSREMHSTSRQKECPPRPTQRVPLPHLSGEMPSTSAQNELQDENLRQQEDSPENSEDPSPQEDDCKTSSENWSSYTVKNLRRPPSEKLRSKNVRKLKS